MDNFVGTKLNSRRLARRAKGRMPEVSPLAAYAQLALVNEDQLERGPRGSQGDFPLASGAQGRSPASAAMQWQPISPAGLAACKAESRKARQGCLSPTLRSEERRVGKERRARR